MDIFAKGLEIFEIWDLFLQNRMIMWRKKKQKYMRRNSRMSAEERRNITSYYERQYDSLLNQEQLP